MWIIARLPNDATELIDMFAQAAEVRRGLDRDRPYRRAFAQLLAKEGKGEAGEIRAATGATDDDIRIIASSRKSRSKIWFKTAKGISRI